MICEFCSLQLEDLTAARRHMLTAAHIREKRSYDLSVAKTVERRRLAKLQPLNFQELLKLLNIHSIKDISALEKMDFFEITRSMDSKIARELIRVLCQSAVDFHMSKLPIDLRARLEQLLSSNLTDNM